MTDSPLRTLYEFQLMIVFLVLCLMSVSWLSVWMIAWPPTTWPPRGPAHAGVVMRDAAAASATHSRNARARSRTQLRIRSGPPSPNDQFNSASDRPRLAGRYAVIRFLASPQSAQWQAWRYNK